jgi:hypothetical protein
MTDQKQLENMEYLSYLGSLITDDARCTGEIKYRIITAKAAFNKQTLFHQQNGHRFKEGTRVMQHLKHS